jgi:PIN domain nuclease of toxin-antitoxin system
MTVLDAFALIAFLNGEPAAGMVEKELRRTGGDEPVMSALNLAEVIDQLTRVAHFSEDAVASSIEMVVAGGLVITAVDEPTARLAGRLRAGHYKKKASSVSMADGVALATSIRLDRKLATADPELATMARKEGIMVLALPDSLGRKP